MQKPFKVSSLATAFLLAALFLSSFTKAFAQSEEHTVQTVIHLLSYVAMDYPGAVQDGKIISDQEYKEQQEFSAQAYQLTKNGSFLSGQEKEDVLAQIQSLQDQIDRKVPEEDVNKIANNINSTIITITGVETAPKIWPDIKQGKTIYVQVCAPCHGQQGRGDGELAKDLDPTPSNFHDAGLMEHFSPYQAYSSIKLGVPGTSMKAFTELNEQELWELAFYVKSLRFQEEGDDSVQLRKAFQSAREQISLAKVATLTDKELLDTLRSLGGDAALEQKALRSLSPAGPDAFNSLPVAKDGLRQALKSYADGNRSLARTQAISAYLEGIEPVEARLRTRHAAFVLELEQQMFRVRQVIEKDEGTEALQKEVDKAIQLINRADDLMKSQPLNYWLTFIIAASIFLREGLEAFLILAVVLAIIRKSGARKALPWLHGGWITAVILGIVGWFLSDYIIQFGGKNREVLEGLVSLFAVFILIFAGFWLHNKSYAKQWTAFVQDKVGRYLNKDKMLGLAAFSFMVVFREAFEVILFLRAISLEAAAKNQSAIGLGVLAAVVCIAVIAYIFLKYARLVPVRKLFLYSSFIIVLLAIILIGKGVHSLQESGWVNVTELPAMFRMDWMGIYPTVQTVVAQLALIALTVVTYFINKRRQQRA